MDRQRAALGSLIFMVGVAAALQLVEHELQENPATPRARASAVDAEPAIAAAAFVAEREASIAATRTAEAAATTAAQDLDGTDDQATSIDGESRIFVRGRVQNVVDGAAMPFAAIQLVFDDEDEAGEEIERIVPLAADADGAFRLIAPEGSELRATAPGFDVQEIDLPYRSDEPRREVLFELAPAGLLLGRVIVPTGIAPDEVLVVVDVEEIVRGDWPCAVERRAASDGSFRFDDVPLGSLVVVEAYVEGRALGRSLPLRMPDVYGAEVTTDVRLRGRAGLHGVVTYEDGAPADDWCVSLRRLDDGEEYVDVTSLEEDGRFAFDDLPAGEYEVEPFFRRDDVARPSRARRLRLDEGGSCALRLDVERGLPVAGTVISSRPRPRAVGCCRPAGVVLTLERGEELRESIPMQWDVEDCFRFEHVPAGEWLLRFGDAEMRVTAGDIDVVLQDPPELPATAIHGVVQGPGGIQIDPVVSLVVDGEVRRSSRGTDFRFNVKPATAATIFVAERRMRTLELRGVVAREAGDLDVGVLSLELAPQLHGVVLDHAGTPVPEATLVAYCTTNPCAEYVNVVGRNDVTTDDSGAFELVFDERADALWIETPAGYASIDPASLGLRDGATSCTLRLPPPIPVVGRIVTVDGRLVPHLEVALRRAQPWDPSASDDAVYGITNVDGSFAMAVLSGGTWNFAASGDRIGAGFGARTITVSGTKLDLGTIVLPW